MSQYFADIIEAKRACLSALFVDPSADRARAILSDLARWDRHFTHPKQAVELRRPLSKLAYYAVQMALPADDRRASIRAKLALDSQEPLSRSARLILDHEIDRILDDLATEYMYVSADAVGEPPPTLQANADVPHDRVTTLELLSQEGTLDVDAWSDSEARNMAPKEGLPEGGEVVSVQCIRQPRRGFLGVRRRIGSWRVTYLRPSTWRIGVLTW